MGVLDKLKFWENTPVVREKKNYQPRMAFAEYLGYTGDYDLMAFEAIRLYKKCKPFYHAVNIRSRAFAQLPMVVVDGKSGEIVDHPVLALFKNPNPSQSQNDFMQMLSVLFDVCGESFLYATGQVNKPPLELFTVSPQDVSPIGTAKTIGAISGYLIANQVLNAAFKLDDNELGGSYRFYSQDDKELVQIKNINPTSMSNYTRGHSPASTLWLQIQQFVEADTNNWSLLKRGARPSVAWVWQHDEPMDDDQYTRWVEQVKAYEGSINAGRQVLVDNMKPEIISQTNRDMEFAINRKTVSNDIYTAFDIPLALVSSDQMTMDNLKVSTTIMYDMSILPHADKLFSALTRAIMPRYPDSENLAITYDRSEVPALRERTWAEATAMKGTGVIQDNEIRNAMGYDDIEVKPVADDATKSYGDYIKGLKGEDGKPLFSEKEAAIMSAKYSRH